MTWQCIVQHVLYEMRGDLSDEFAVGVEANMCTLEQLLDMKAAVNRVPVVNQLERGFLQAIEKVYSYVVVDELQRDARAEFIQASSSKLSLRLMSHVMPRMLRSSLPLEVLHRALLKAVSLQDSALPQRRAAQAPEVRMTHLLKQKLML